MNFLSLTSLMYCLDVGMKGKGKGREGKDDPDPCLHDF